jgi:hypothetical protein
MNNPFLRRLSQLSHIHSPNSLLSLHEASFVSAVKKYQNITANHFFLIAEKLLLWNNKQITTSLKYLLNREHNCGLNAFGFALSLITVGHIEFTPEPTKTTKSQAIRLKLLFDLARTPSNDALDNLMLQIETTDFNQPFWINSLCFQLALKHILKSLGLKWTEYRSFSRKFKRILSYQPDNQLTRDLHSIIDHYKGVSLLDSDISDHVQDLEFVNYLKEVCDAGNYITESDRIDQSLTSMSNSVQFSSSDISIMVKKLIHYGYTPSESTFCAIFEKVANDEPFEFWNELHSVISGSKTHECFLILLKSLRCRTVDIYVIEEIIDQMNRFINV